jgi:predicted transcriptional regulator
MVTTITKRSGTITADVTASIQMNNLPHANNVEKLRADLRHFEENGDFGENSTVTEIKAHLLRRIVELEAALQRTDDLELSTRPTPLKKHQIQ